MHLAAHGQIRGVPGLGRIGRNVDAIPRHRVRIHLSLKLWSTSKTCNSHPSGEGRYLFNTYLFLQTPLCKVLHPVQCSWRLHANNAGSEYPASTAQCYQHASVPLPDAPQSPRSLTRQLGCILPLSISSSRGSSDASICKVSYASLSRVVEQNPQALNGGAVRVRAS